MTTFDQGDLVDSYTDDQALQDGAIWEPFPEKWPKLYVTAGVIAGCRQKSENGPRTFGQVLVPLIGDLIMATKKAIMNNPSCDLVALHHTALGTVWSRPNMSGGMTIMLPEEN